jgi:RND superfamily putative drug exporter
VPKSFFDSLNGFIRRRYRAVIGAWAVAVLLSLILIPSFFSAVSYDLTSGFGVPSNTESERAASIIQSEFPPPSNSSGNSILVVIQGAQVFSDSLKQSMLALDGVLSKDSNVSDYIGETSLYSLEANLLNSSLPDIVTQAAGLQSNISEINTGLYSLQQNLSMLSTNLFELQDGINQTSQLVYGVPTAFVGVFEGITAQGVSDPYMADAQANATLFSMTDNFGGDAQSIAYYSTFFNFWDSSFQTSSNSSLTDREALTINETVMALIESKQLDPQTSQMVTLVASGLNVTTWDQPEAVAGLAISTLASSIPTELSSSLGVSPLDLVSQLYSLGPSPSSAVIGNYTVGLFESNYASAASSDFPISSLIQASYLLGQSPSEAQVWDLSCFFIANATQSSFEGSPLFSVNGTSLANLISSLPPNATVADINSAIQNLVSNQSYMDYPYIPSNALTDNFINKENNTMIVILGFSSDPDEGTIAQVESDVQNSGLGNFGTVYVTGDPVLTNDVQNAFLPAITLSLGPGIGFSLLIVGLLFLAPFAALIPVLVGGVSISVALASIYIGVVKIGHGSLTFLTPTLTMLLMLGLAVDYSVLQLRRTKEERQQGKSTEESVHLSVKWAGQAILTAATTVIVAYIVMAASNVPLFSDVGTAIALGVSILLLASLTLLPALEIALGDRIFWPSLNRKGNAKSSSRKDVLKRVSRGTLKRKVPIVIFISAVALCAFFVAYNTPTSGDFLKLIPNFSSNQGLTSIENNFGTGVTEPTSIVVTTTTPIVYGDAQFNQTLLNQLDQIAAAAAGSNGVVTVTGITRPFGEAFNYLSVGNMSAPIMRQYESQMLSTIGENNETALITVGLSGPASSHATVDFLQGMEKNIEKLSLVGGTTIYYGGQTQSTIDDQAFMSNLLPEVIIILAIAIYLILFFQLRSVFTPFRLIFTILCSIVFSLAILSLVFYTGLDLPILNFAPLFVVVTMLGVGIDYDIFFVTRVREEVLNGKTDLEAITNATHKIWVTIFFLGVILSTVFASLLITGIAILQEVSLAVAVAVFIDVTAVILFLVPSIMGLAQRFNWWPHSLSKRTQKQESSTG